MVTGHRLGNLGAVLRTGNFEVVSGVRLDQGGDDDGPDPHQLIEAALAACTIITVQMYANHKNWPVVSVNVEVKIESESSEGSSFAREISFTGDLSVEQRQRLFEIAEKCPIHRLLAGKIEIRSSLKN